jgi:hypothetical protein
MTWGAWYASSVRLPDGLAPAGAAPEEKFAELARRLFAADPVKVGERLEAEKAARAAAARDGPKKSGRPSKAAP